MRNLSTILIFIFAFSINSFGQKKLFIKSDTTFNQTLMVSENTIIDGGNFKVTFKGEPKVMVANKSTLMLKNMKVGKVEGWGTLNCGCIEWNFTTWKGHLDDAQKNKCSFKCGQNTYLDGSAKQRVGNI